MNLKIFMVGPVALPNSCHDECMHKLGRLIFFPMILGACAGPAAPRAPADPAHVEALLMQMIDQGMNRLGQPNGFWNDPAVRIGLPEDLARAEKSARRFGLERPLEEWHAALNHAAEAAMPAAKTLLRDMAAGCLATDAVPLARDGNDTVTRRVQVHCDALLLERLRPIVVEAAQRQHLVASYKRLVKRLSVLERGHEMPRLDLEAWLTRAVLNGMYTALADEERRARRKKSSHSPK